MTDDQLYAQLLKDQTEREDRERKEKIAQARMLGIILVIFGGTVAVITGVYVSHSADPLWAFILVGFLIERVRDTKAEYPNKPAFLGLVMGALALVIAGAAYYLKTPEVLWALLLVGFVTDYII